MVAATVERTRPRALVRWRRGVLEVAIVAVLYFGYRFGRLIGLGREDVARTHADAVHEVERFLHLPSEAAIQQWIGWLPHVYELANRYYVGLHFPAIVAFLLWGLLRRPYAEYLWARNLLVVQTALALVIHIAFPLAPPRMFPQWGFVDTMAVYGPNAYGASTATVANQFAAMPSLHIGWSLLIAVVLVRTAPRPVKVLGVGHFLLTTFVVVITANHWWLDGAVAAGLLAVAVVLFPAPGRYRVHRPARLRQATKSSQPAAR